MKRLFRGAVMCVAVWAFFLVPRALWGETDSPVWKGNQIGISDVPPPPFEPVVLTKQGDVFVVKCWGRTYTLGPTGLPLQINSMRADLLASPIEISMHSGGKAVAWERPTARIERESAVQVALAGEAESPIGTLAWKCTAEYDGLLRYDLEISPRDLLDPKTAEAVELLKMSVNINRGHAVYNWRQGIAKGHQGLLPSGDGVIGTANTYTWIGDSDRGLALFYETDEAWDDPSRSDGREIVRTDNSVSVVWTFVNDERKMTSPWRFTFGIQGTPVKDTRWGRKYRIEGHLPILEPTDGSFVVPWSDGADTLTQFGFPEAKLPKKYRRMVDWYHRLGFKVTPYVLVTMISSGVPEAATHPGWIGKRITERDGHSMNSLTYSADYIDFIVWKCDQFVREMNVDGFYHDFTSLMPYQVEREGKKLDVFPYFGERELYKRVYTMLKQHSKDAFNVAHMSANNFVPILAFCDVGLDGEWTSKTWPGRPTYKDLLEDEFVQAAIMGHNMGLRKMLLYGGNEMRHIGQYNLVSRALLYDFVIYCFSIDQERAFKAFDEFGATDAEFVPFWRNGDIIQGQTDEVKCALYRKVKGGSLLVVVNQDKEQAREVTFTVDWEKLKSAGELVVRDVFPGGDALGGWLTLIDNDIPIDGACMTLKVRPDNFRIIAVH